MQFMYAIAPVRSLIILCLLVAAGLNTGMAQTSRHFQAGELPSADDVARLLGGCPQSEDCQAEEAPQGCAEPEGCVGMRTRQIAVKRWPRAAAGFSMPVQFELGSARLTPDAIANLSTVVEGLSRVVQANPQVRIAIEGHADRSGDEAFNRDLSIRRAQAVRDYLVAHAAISNGNFIVQGYGSGKPLAGVDPRSATNRRVEFKRVD